MESGRGSRATRYRSVVSLDQRVPEPELMEDPAQARAYSDADFSVAHQAIVDDLLARSPDLVVADVGVVDLGCGPADVTVRLASALPGARVTGLDAGPTMLALGRRRVAEAGLDGRVRLEQGHLPLDGSDLERLGRFHLVTSNSLLHHLARPGDLWVAVEALAAPDAVVHVVDLVRPFDEQSVAALVRREASDAPPVLQADFANSLRAAYRTDEVVEQLERAGMAAWLEVTMISDRHLVVHGRRPTR